MEKDSLKLATPRNLRLYESDDEQIKNLVDEVGPFTGLNIRDIIRNCVRSGLPIITKKVRQLAKG